MNKKKLLQKLQALFDTESQKKRHHIAQIKKILKNLKKKERNLAEALLKSTDASQQKKYQTELHIIHEQRKKGIALLQEVKDKQH